LDIPRRPSVDDRITVLEDAGRNDRITVVYLLAAMTDMEKDGAAAATTQRGGISVGDNDGMGERVGRSGLRKEKATVTAHGDD
jgi:hypothetical protein